MFPAVNYVHCRSVWTCWVLLALLDIMPAHNCLTHAVCDMVTWTVFMFCWVSECVVLFCIHLFLLSSLSLAKFLVHCVLPYSVLLAVGKKFSFSVIVLHCYVKSVFYEFFFVVFYSRSTSLFMLWDCVIKRVNTQTCLSCPVHCMCVLRSVLHIYLLLARYVPNVAKEEYMRSV